MNIRIDDEYRDWWFLLQKVKQVDVFPYLKTRCLCVGPEPAYLEWSGQGTGLDCNSLMCHGMQTMPKLWNLEIYRYNDCPKIELGNYLVIGSCNTFVYWLYYQLQFNSYMYVMLQWFELSTTVFFPNDFLRKL